MTRSGSRVRAIAVLGVLAASSGGASQAWAVEPTAEAPPRARRHGLDDTEPAFKWSAPTLAEKEWVIGLRTVAYGVDDSVTVGVESANVLLGHYNLRTRVALGEPGADGPSASLEAGVGIFTSLAVAGLFVPNWDGRPPLAVVDLAAPITWTPRSATFVTLRPWAAAAAGRVEDDDRRLAALIGRPALTGAGAELLVEGHLSHRVGMAAWGDVGVDAFGSGARLGTRNGVALLVASGPVRLNVGIGLAATFDLTDGAGVQLQPVPAIDIWVRL